MSIKVHHKSTSRLRSYRPAFLLCFCCAFVILLTAAALNTAVTYLDLFLAQTFVTCIDSVLYVMLCYFM